MSIWNFPQKFDILAKEMQVEKVYLSLTSLYCMADSEF